MINSGPITGRMGLGEGPLTSRLFKETPPLGNGFVQREENRATALLPDAKVPFDSGWARPTSGVAGEAAPAATQLGLPTGATRLVAQQLADAPESEERNQLCIEWHELNLRVSKFLTEAREQRIAGLRNELDHVLLQGRAALETWRQCQVDVRTAQGRLNAQLEGVGKARVEFLTAEGERPRPEEWPTEAELVKYHERLDRALEKANRAEKHQLELQRTVDEAEAHARTARANLDAMAERRDQLQAKIEGRSYKGPFGLVVPAANL